MILLHFLHAPFILAIDGTSFNSLVVCCATTFYWILLPPFWKPPLLLNSPSLLLFFFRLHSDVTSFGSFLWPPLINLGRYFSDGFLQAIHALLPHIWFTSGFSAQGPTPISHGLCGLTWVESESHLGLDNVFGPLMTSIAYQSRYSPWPPWQADMLAERRRNPIETGLRNQLWFIQGLSNSAGADICAMPCLPIT